MRLVGEHYDTVMPYRQGDIDAALRLRANTIDGQLMVAAKTIQVLQQNNKEMIARGGKL